eukprot:scaffold10644_cov107-Isochrysis_galbana.AAC.1
MSILPSLYLLRYNVGISCRKGAGWPPCCPPRPRAASIRQQSPVLVESVALVQPAARRMRLSRASGACGRWAQLPTRGSDWGQTRAAFCGGQDELAAT